MFRNITRRIVLLSKKPMINDGNHWNVGQHYSVLATTISEIQQAAAASAAATTTAPSPQHETLDYDVKAERKQTKKDMRGLSDQFKIPPDVGIDDEQYIKALEEHLKSINSSNQTTDSFSFNPSTLEFQQQVPNPSPTTSSLNREEISVSSIEDKTAHDHPHHRRKHPIPAPSVPSGTLAHNTSQDPTKDTSVDED